MAQNLQIELAKDCVSHTTTALQKIVNDESVSQNVANRVILLSGGVESVAMLWMFGKQQYGALYPLFINYGQRNVNKELQASQWACNTMGITFDTIDMSSVGMFFREKQVKAKTGVFHVPIPHRNLVIASLAMSYAAQQKASELCLGLNADDLEKPDYSTGTKHFFDQLVQMGHCLNLNVTAPLIQFTKPEIIRMVSTWDGMDLTKTYSCMTGGEQHCGTCMQCKSRYRSFKDAGVAEPENFYRNIPKSQ